MNCRVCGAPMTELAAFLACGSCGHTEPRLEASARAARPLTGVDLERLPSVLAIPLAEYATEDDPLLALFQTCQAVELMLRLVVALGLADAVRAGGGLLPAALRNELSSRIQEPTLGKWWGMASAVAKHAPGDSAVPELPGFVQHSLAPLLARGPLATSLTEVRNTIAHSGMSRPVAARLLDGGHHQRFVELLLSGAWLGELELVVPRAGATPGVLAGPHAGMRAFRPASSEVMEAVARGACAGDAVVVVRGGAVLSLWPLVFYGLPRTSGLDGRSTKAELPQVYFRRGETRLLLTPVGSVELAQTEAPEDALREFRRLFRADERRPRREVAGFEDEMRRDAAHSVGRATELGVLRAALDETDEGVLWLTGPAGIGKSYLMANLATALCDEPDRRDVVLPYRFQAGDGRCARGPFLRFAVDRLRGDEPHGEEDREHPPRKPLEELRELLARPRHARVVFLLDGLDELAATDARFAEEVPLALGGAGVVWLCAGRPERGLPEAFSRSRHLFAGGLPEMSEGDVREMIVSKIGPLARKLLRGDRTADRDKVVNPFIERVCAAPDGRIPLFVAYLIGDVLSGRMAPDGSTEIPPSLTAWYERQLGRYSVGDLAQVVTPILATLAVAQEPMTSSALHALLASRTIVLGDSSGLALVMRGLACVESLLERTEAPDGGDGYRLRHHTAREHVLASRTTQVAIATSRQALCDAACDWQGMGRGAAGPYLFRQGIGHLVNEGRGLAAGGLMTEFGYFYERLRVLGRSSVTGILKDLAVVPQTGELPAWRRFVGQNAHLLRREETSVEIQFLQLAEAYGDDSEVTLGAHRWLEREGPGSYWLRSVWGNNAGDDACLCTLEGLGSVALGVDGRQALAARDGTLKVWDLDTGACLRTLDGHAVWEEGEELHAYGRQAVSATRDHTLRVWDLENGVCLRTLEGHSAEVSAVALHANGRQALSASRDCTLKVWDLETGACLRTLEGHKDRVSGVALHGDGHRALSASGDGTLKLWDLETGVCVRTFGGHLWDVDAVVLHSDGCRAVSASRDWTLKVWDLENGVCLRTLEGHSAEVSAVALHADGRQAVSASWDRTLKVWDLETGICLRTFRGLAEGSFMSGHVLALHADGRRAVWKGLGEVQVWDLEGGHSRRTTVAHTDAVSVVVRHGDGRRVVSASWDRTLKVWDLESGVCLRTLEGHTDKVTAVALHADGRRAVSASNDRTLRVWDLQTGACLRTLEGHRQRSIGGFQTELYTVQLHTDGRRAVSAGRDRTLRVWDLDSGACLLTLEGHADDVWSVALHVDGRRAVSASQDRTLKVWDLETGACLSTLRGHARLVNSVALHPDGRRAVSASFDGTLKTWDLEAGACLRTLDGQVGIAGPVVLDPSGDQAFSASVDGTVRAWDLETGACRRTPGSVALLADVGRAVLTGGATLTVFDVEADICLARWLATDEFTCCIPTASRLLAGTMSGDLLLLELMPPGIHRLGRGTAKSTSTG